MTTHTTPIRAIRAKCLDCSAGQPLEVRLCPRTACELYPFRMGKNPNIKPRNLTDEQRQALADRLARSRTSTATTTNR
ncbi:MAG: hypothetical protein WCZ23_10710 [Rhodospirillaceae bacterium]